MGAAFGGGPAYGGSMSQGGVPGGGVVKLKKQIPSVECKFFDSPIALAGATQVWTRIDNNAMLSGIVQGTGPQQRVGRKIKVVGIIVRYAFQVNQGPYCFDLVRDKQCNGVAATSTQIYTLPLEYGSLPNPFEETRFQFLKRIESYNPAQASDVSTSTACSISFVKKCNIVVEYNASTGAVSDLTSDNVQLYCNNAQVGALVGIVPTGAAGERGFIRVLYTDA